MTPDTPDPLTDAELRAEAVPVTVTNPATGATGETGPTGEKGATGPEGPPASGVPPPTAQLVGPAEATATEVIRQQVLSQDYLVLRFAVLGLMLAIVMTLAGVVYLASVEKELPDGIVAIGSASVGALATMLVRPPPPVEQPPRFVGERRASQLPPKS